MTDKTTKQKRDVRFSDILALLGSGASVAGLSAAIASALGASPALLISGASILISFFAGLYAKDIAQVLRKVSGSKRVFLSFSHSDNDIAYELADALRKNGAKIWTAGDRIKPGESISGAIEKALDDSDTFVVFLGPEISKGVLYELGLAKAKGLKIIPFLTKAGQAPADLQGIKYINLENGKDQAVKKLIEAATK